MRKSLRLLVTITFSLFISKISFGQVWKDVAPIIYKNCSGCHRAGEIGPFPLMSYYDAANCPSLGKIPENVNSGLMPPWKADPNYRHFLDERILTQEEKDLISNWVAASVPAGDTTEAPPPPVFPTGSQIGIPDLVLTMAEPYTIKGNGLDDYECFVLPTNLLQGQDISAIEFRPGNGSAVHHVFLYLVADSSAVHADEQTPEYGYPSFGGIGQDVHATFLGLFAPGLVPRPFPANGIVNFPAGSFFVIQVHYAPLTYVTTDQSSVNLFFSDYTTPRVVNPTRIGESYITNPPFKIKANEVDTFYSAFPVPGPTDFSLFAIAPHMHLLGKSYKIFNVSTQGDTLPLIYIPSWDFHWQLLYSYPYLLHLQKESMVYAIAIYDNTTNNPLNPNNPPEDVKYGESSSDEMFKYFINTLAYQWGDEDIIIDSNYNSVGGPPIDGIVYTPQLYSCYPNPSRDKTEVSYYLPPATNASIIISDVTGRIVEQRNVSSSGLQRFALDVTGYGEGQYFVTLKSDKKTLTKSFIVQR